MSLRLSASIDNLAKGKVEESHFALELKRAVFGQIREMDFPSFFDVQRFPPCVGKLDSILPHVDQFSSSKKILVLKNYHGNSNATSCFSSS